MLFTHTLKVGDIITTYHKGFWKVIKIYLPSNIMTCQCVADSKGNLTVGRRNKTQDYYLNMNVESFKMGTDVVKKTL